MTNYTQKFLLELIAECEETILRLKTQLASVEVDAQPQTPTKERGMSS